MHRYFIYLAYDGGNYHGWQIQPNGDSVQENLMKALSLVLREDIPITGAGRTDTGVHAKQMVAHFDFQGCIDTCLLVDKLNKMLPRDIVIFKICEVNAEAHARFDALSREYQYDITTYKNPFIRDYAYQLYFDVDIDLMNQACKTLFEYTDFTSFSKLHSDTKTNNCEIYKAEWEQLDATTFRFHIKANRFLRNMVRAIVGTLLEVGRGKMSIEQFRQVIESKNRSAAGFSVPGHALSLVAVEFPDTIFDI